MSPSLALVVYIAAGAGLFFLDRESCARPSKAVWLSVVWLWINGSRPPSAWLGMNIPKETPGQLPPTSLLDQSVAGCLIVFAAIVLIGRGRTVIAALKSSWPVALFFSYCLTSLAWSDFPGWGFKRWLRALGDLLMVLIIVTDAQPSAALRRLFSRVGFILLPASLLLIKYFPDMGRGFTPQRLAMNMGVTTNKTTLGVLVYVITLGTVWQVLSLWLDKNQPHRARRLLAQGTLLYLGISLVYTAHSATSTVATALGAALMLATVVPPTRRHPAAVHVFVFVILLGGGLITFVGGSGQIAQAMGRNSDFNGRTEVWDVVVPMVTNKLGGAGFETFWVGPRVLAVADVFHSFTNESHNGYIETYVNLGWIGISLIALILVRGYFWTAGAFRRDPALGALLVAFVVTAAIYNITEAGFRMLGPGWFFLLFSVVAARSVPGVQKDLGLPGDEPAPLPIATEQVGIAEYN